jgi:hypothetical protein
MDKTKRKYDAEVAVDSSLQLQLREQKQENYSEKDKIQTNKPAKVFTTDIIMDLIDRIKRL